MSTQIEKKVTDIVPGDRVMYGGRLATVRQQWRWDDNVGLKLDGYIGYVVLGRWDTMRVEPRS